MACYFLQKYKPGDRDSMPSGEIVEVSAEEYSKAETPGVYWVKLSRSESASPDMGQGAASHPSHKVLTN